MNGYMIDGILRDASHGMRVAVFANSRVRLTAAFAALSERASDASRIQRAHGRECIELPNGGRVTFHCAAQGGGRGVSPDIAYVDEWDAMSEKAQEDIAAATCRGALIVT